MSEPTERERRTGEAGADGLVVHGLRKSYGGRVAVDGLSMNVEPGEIYGLLGPNGAGKTTTIGMIASVLQPDAGEVRIGGAVTGSRSRDLGSLIGLVPQELSLYPPLSAEANLRLFAEVHRVPIAELGERVDDMLRLAGLSERRRDSVRSFSGGMQRRLNLVCGLVHRPRVLLLDEPTAGVDPQSRERIFEMIEREADDGLSVLYTTHYMEEAERLCHRIGIIDDGRLVAEGTKSDLVRRLGDERTVRVALVAAPNEALEGGLASLGASLRPDGRYLFSGADLEERVRNLLSLLAEHGNGVRSMNWSAPNLEDLFLRLTGKALRD